MKSGKLTLIIVIVFVLVNGAAAAIYLATKTPDTDAHALALAEEAKTEGVRAMQAGRYDDAARSLERAIALGDGSDSTRELLATVEAERTRAASAPIALADAPMTEPVPPEAPEPSMIQPEREIEEPTPQEMDEPEIEAPEDEEPEMGRAPTARERRLYELRRARERAQEEEEEEPEPEPPPVEPEPEPVVEPTPQPPPAMVEPTPQPVRTTPMTEPVRPSMTPAPIPEPTGTEVGELEILSRVDGEVYVNGRRYGTAPRIVRHVPAGRARVEIREGGRVVSSTTVTVRARERRSVLLR